METIRKTLHDFRWRERTVRLGGDYPDKRFYVIRRHADHAGLFSFAATNLGSVVEAAARGYTPVIDMQNAPNPMLAPEEVGRVNAWDRFFLPPCGYSLSDIAHARHVTLGVITPPEKEFYPDYSMILHPAELAMWRQAAARYLHLRPEVEERIDTFCRAEFGFPGEGGADPVRRPRRILGVLCRGTDYVQARPHNHPMQPRTEAVIARCREVLEERACDGIYLCTEDEEIWEEMQAAFPGKIISYQRHRFRLQRNENINDAAGRVLSPYEHNLQYLTAIGILARCPCLVAGAAGGTYGALLLTKGYEYEYIFKLGRYETQEPAPGTWEYENAAR